MIDITSFLLKHLYELMADNYNATVQRDSELALRRQQLAPPAAEEPTTSGVGRPDEADEPDELQARLAGGPSARPPGSCGAEQQQQQQQQQQQPRPRPRPTSHSPLALLSRLSCCQRRTGRSSRQTRRLVAREQETNQQIVSFLINNQLPDLACETLIELIFISVFLAISWIFVMIIQLHCQQQQHQAPLAPGQLEASGQAHSYQSARHFYCNTKFLNSLMYCNNRESKLLPA